MAVKLSLLDDQCHIKAFFSRGAYLLIGKAYLWPRVLSNSTQVKIWSWFKRNFNGQRERWKKSSLIQCYRGCIRRTMTHTHRTGNTALSLVSVFLSQWFCSQSFGLPKSSAQFGSHHLLLCCVIEIVPSVMLSEIWGKRQYFLLPGFQPLTCSFNRRGDIFPHH